MKNFYFVLLFLSSAFSMSAADVTFSVDMNGYTEPFTQVYVSGSLNGWSGDANPLSDEDEDGVWTATIPLDDGAYEFKFTLDGWAVQEQFEAGAACTKTSGDNNEFTNRNIGVSGDMTICFRWNTCTNCDGTEFMPATSDVSFSVDMNGYTEAFTQVYVSGSLNGWSGDANPLSDEDGDGVWSAVIPVVDGGYEYKFTLDGWAVQEQFESGVECTATSGDNGEFVNRTLAVNGATEVCFAWNTCNSCISSTSNVIFSVDMSGYSEAFTQVYVSGSLNGWSGDANPLADADGDGIWSGVIPLDNGDYEYKFTLDNWSVQEEFSPGGDCTVTSGDNNEFTNRAISVAGDAEACFLWNTCMACPMEVDSFNVTFTVDMSLEDSVDAEGIFLAGTFNGWSNTPMMDNGDGTWTYTGKFGQGDMLAYKFKNGPNGWEANDVRSCTIEGSLGDRGHTVGGADEVLPTVCFNSCAACFLDVTFVVDPSQEEVAPEGMFIAGSFNGWTDGPMTLDEATGLWSATLSLSPGTSVEYKFKNGPNGWEGDFDGICSIDGTGNRVLVVPETAGALPAACFNSCVGCNQVVLTVTVDMNQETVAEEGVFIAGGFNGWTDGPMTDNGNGTYSASIVVDKNSTVEYKFKNGPNGWEGDFNGDCGTGNRSVMVGEMDVTVAEVCFNSCTACTLPMVTFTVDMSEQEVAAEGVFLSGAFNDFTDMAMTDNGDGTWSATVQVAPRTAYEYIFKNGPNGSEVVPASCAFGFFGNRQVNVSNVDVVLPTVCFNNCVGCGLVGVTFTVDMSQENVDAAGVRVAGSFSEWTDVLLMDAGNGIWFGTVGVMPNQMIEFKYKNGPDGWEGSLEGECAAENGNRILVIADLDASVAQTCFNSCEICMEEPDPDPIGLTTLNIENSCINDDGTITIRFDLQFNCDVAPGNLAGMSEIGFHSGANNWSSVVAWDAEGAMTAVNNGSDVFEVTIDPVAYYDGIESLDDLENIMMVFNQGPTVPDEPWASEGKTNGEGGLGVCADIMLVVSELRNCADIGGSDMISSAAILDAGSCVGEDGTVTLNFNLADNCMEAPGSLVGMSEIGFHSGANDWTSVVAWDAEGAMTATNNGEDVFSVTIDPATYYGVALADLSNISFVYNQGPSFPDDAWASEGKAQGDGACVDFIVAISELPTCVMEPSGPVAQDLPLTFENDNVEYMLFAFGEANAERIDNPDGDGKVLSIEKTNGAQPWAGVAMPVATVIDLSSNAEMHLDIWSPRAGVPVLLKIEDTNSAPDANGNPSVIAEVFANTTVANAWETLTFDMSTHSGFATTNAYNQVVVFPDMNNAGVGETFYVDNIRTDLTISTVDLVEENQFRVAPNPFNDQTLVTWNNASNARYQVNLLNVTGQVVKSYQNVAGESLVITRENLVSGLYFLNFRDEKGNMGTMKLLID